MFETNSLQKQKFLYFFIETCKDTVIAPGLKIILIYYFSLACEVEENCLLCLSCTVFRPE